MVIEKILATGIIPDFLLRLAIRYLNQVRLREETEKTLEKQQEKLNRIIDELKNSPIAILTEKANEQHYEVPAEFYDLVLGEHKKYSCCYYVQKNFTLSQAEEAMLKLYAERALVKDGQKILDLGCGWGSLSLFLAENYPRAKIWALSNSHSQREYIERKIQERNIKNLKVITTDINKFQTKEKFDRIISIEMFEHLRNYELLFYRISNWLKNDGKLFVHIFSHKEFCYFFEDKTASDWIARYFFSGGIMPSDRLFFYFNKDLRIVQHWQVDGLHYHYTAEAWLKNMDLNRKKILPIFQKIYGAEYKKWFIFWRIFFMAVSELFATNRGKEWLVSHYLFEKIR